MMHIFSMKRDTKKKSIEKIDNAPLLYLSLSQHIGKPAEPVVAIGEQVKKYQIIAQGAGVMSANIHAPVSGIIQSIGKHPQAEGSMTDMIVLANDFRYEELVLPSDDVAGLTPEQIIALIKDAGIVGEGGAQFPTHIKYTLQGHKIDTFIINGTECEPYLTADYILMKEYTSQLFEGITIVNKILNASRIVLSIEEQNKDLLDVFRPFLAKTEYNHIQVKVLPNQYPQGGELQLIKSVTGKVLPRGVLPRDEGIIVSNAGTVYAVYKAVAERKPLTERIVTISGEESKRIGNLEVAIGTPISHILQSQGLSGIPDEDIVVLGGPMMGKNVVDTSAPVTKGSSGVLLFRKKEIKRNNCISCGYCVDVCPMHLMPMKFEENYRKEKYSQLEKYSLSLCIECAACEYICPSDVPLIESIKKGKQKQREINN
ncbi:electron transport complex subunit RsxC [Dysgonomonas macrotermitis]|nr:electron transport complex subunit RsxC [Dysgonomonas macrotermitis]